MNLREPGKARHDFVDLGIVLHRTRTERIKLAFYSEVSLRQAGKMTQRFKLAQLREPRDLTAQKRVRNRTRNLFSLRPEKRASARRTALEDELRLGGFCRVTIERPFGQADRPPLFRSSQ